MTNEMQGPGKKRPYRMKRRAELEQRTRQRITESAVDLHRTLGPAHTSVSAVAQHAGVRRSTVYRHFPDERALFTACTAHWSAANPPPELERWRTIDDPQQRLRVALGELYAYYRRTAPMLDNVLRDEAAMPLITEMLAGYRGYLDGAGQVLTSGWQASGDAWAYLRATIGHALAFATWRSLVREQGLEDDQAAELMGCLATAAARHVRGSSLSGSAEQLAGNGRARDRRGSEPNPDHRAPPS
jgi:AcrR family transcriptional regulator